MRYNREFAEGERVVLTIDLPEDLERQLDALAHRAGRSPAEYAREMLVERLGDLEDLRAAEEVVRAIRRGDDKPVPLADVMKRYGLAD